MIGQGNQKRLLFWPGLLLLAFAMVGCSSNKLNLDPASQQFYEVANLIMTKDEKAIFKTLEDVESRELFIQEFWDKLKWNTSVGFGR